ncbi:MAG: hypothetical protein ABJN65_13455 [Parasphingorhabdus sp.]
MKKLILGTAILGLTQPSVAYAQVAEKCVQPEQAAALISYILPKAIEAAKSKCEPSLSIDSTLMEVNSERFASYQAASEAAWPKAKEAVNIIGGDKLPGDIDDSLLKPLADAIFTGMIAEQIKPKDCALIDQIYTDLAPMPSSNIASLTVTIIQAATKDDKKADLPICKTPA